MSVQPDPDEYLADAQLPPQNDNVVNLDGEDGMLWVPLDQGYEIGEWCPLPDGEGDPTEVHMMMKNQEMGLGVSLLLKSPRAVNELISTLRRHRDAVWKG